MAYELQQPVQPKRGGGFGALLKFLGVIFLILVVIFIILASIDTSSTPSTPAMSITEMKSKAEKIPYKDLARDTEQYIGKPVVYDGKVVQVMEGYNSSYTLRVNITKRMGAWDDIVLVTCVCEKRPLEDDLVHFVGIVEGRTSYKTILGATITLPEIDAAEFEIK